MVLAYHIIVTAYGFWLPNDPRGSWSDFIHAWELWRFGPATHTHSPRSVARDPHDRTLRQTAKTALRYPPVSFTGHQCLAIAHGFTSAIRRSNFVIHACSLLPEHAHLIVARHRYDAEHIMNQLKGEASKALMREGLHPFAETFLPSGKRHSPWAQDGWKVFLDSPDDITRAIAYVHNNPMKEGFPPQRWSFLTPYPSRADPNLPKPAVALDFP